VTQLDNAANLYKTAGAAWTIATATLFHLSLRIIETDSAALRAMKDRMQARTRERNTCKESEAAGTASRDFSACDVLIEMHDLVSSVMNPIMRFIAIGTYAHMYVCT
jgi:hypothetical protein